MPDLRRGLDVLVVAHGNSLRALIKHLDGMSGEAVVALNVPTGIPLHYDLDPLTMMPTKPGEYLDPEAAVASIAAVANQGKRQPADAVSQILSAQPRCVSRRRCAAGPGSCRSR